MVNVLTFVCIPSCVANEHIQLIDAQHGLREAHNDFSPKPLQTGQSCTRRGALPLDSDETPYPLLVDGWGVGLHAKEVGGELSALVSYFMESKTKIGVS